MDDNPGQPTLSKLKQDALGVKAKYMSWNRHTLTYLLVFLIILSGLLIRLNVVSETFIVGPLRSDALEYYSYAQNLKEFGVYSRQYRQLELEQKDLVPDAHRNPGYVYFLLPFTYYPPSYEMLSKIYLAQVLVSTLSLLLAFVFFRSFLSWPAALGGLLLVSMSPHIISMNNYVLSECLFIFFLVLSSLGVLRFSRDRTVFSALILGGVLALTVLVRPTVLYLPLLLLLLLKNLKIENKKLMLGVLTTGFFLVYSPWMIRNHLNVPESDDANLMVMTIQKGMYPDLMYQDDPETYGTPNDADPEWLNRNTLPKVFAEIKRRVSEEPLRYLRWYLLGKPKVFFSWSIIVGEGDVIVYPAMDSPFFNDYLIYTIHEIMYWLHWPLVLMGLLMSVLVWLPFITRHLDADKLVPTKFCSLLILYFIAVHIVGTPLPRYSIPIFPFIYAMSMLFLASCWSLWKNRQHRN